MELSLSELVASIGTSIQSARRAVDESAAQLYFRGFGREEGENGAYWPIERKVYISREEGPIGVPETALMSHQSIRLDQVDVKMKLIPCDANGTLAFRIGADRAEEEGAQEQSWAEFSLSFQSGDMPEGMARVNQKLSQFL